MGILDRILGRRDPARRQDLARAAAAVDRELAGNLELTAMFDTTSQAVVFENGEFVRHRDILAREVPGAFAGLADVYGRMSQTEAAMERRGPAGSIRPEDRSVIEAWEGDVREAQRTLRLSAQAGPPTLWSALFGRSRGGRQTGR